MKRLWWIFAISIAIACPIGAHAASATHSVNIGGAGRDPCAVWSEDRAATSDSAKLAVEHWKEWFLGFFSAINLFNDPSGNLRGGIDDSDGMLVWIDNYCSTHPRDPLWAVAADLVLDLKNHPRK